MPKGTPTELARLRGTFNNSRQKRLAQASGDIGQAPEHLNKVARRIWRQTVASAPDALLKQMDRPMLAIYCAAAALIEQAQIKLADLPPNLDKRGKELQAAAHAIISRQTRLLLQTAKMLGLTPEMRSRMDLPAPAEKPKGDWADVEPIAS